VKPFIDDIRANWAVLVSAPWAFATVALLAITLTAALVRWITSEQIAGLKERLAAKDDQLQEYRERLKLVPPVNTIANLTNKQLQEKAISKAAEIREFLSNWKREQRARSEARMQRTAMAKTEEERRKLWRDDSEDSSQRYFAFFDLYNTKFKVDAILLKDEMVTRLPKDSPRQVINSSFEFPTPTTATEVADELERLAKMIPAK
jgi:hypothetical protein